MSVYLLSLSGTAWISSTVLAAALTHGTGNTMASYRQLTRRLKRQARKMKRKARKAERDAKRAQRKLKQSARKAKRELARLEREAKKVHLECTCGKQATYRNPKNVPSECPRCGGPVVWC